MLFRSFLLCFLIPLVPAATPMLSAGWPPEGDFELQPQWSHQVELEPQPSGILTIQTTGDDPYVVFTPRPDISFDENATVLAFEYFCPDGVDHLEVFHAPGDQRPPQWSADRSIQTEAMPVAEGWQPFAVNLRPVSEEQWPSENTAFRLDFGRIPDVHLQIRNLVLRSPTETEQLSADARRAVLEEKQATADEIDHFLTQEYANASIDRIAVTARHIEIEGRVDRPRHTAARLVEWQPHEEEWAPLGGTVLEGESLAEEFSLQLDRFANGRDRLANRFSIAAIRNGDREALTPARWADDVAGAAEREMPRLRPANRKAMSGVSNEELEAIGHDLDELGVSAATVNMLLENDLLVHSGEGIPFEHQGRTYYFNRSGVEAWDAKIRSLTERSIVTSAVLLIHNANELLTHPEMSPSGIYGMLDLTNSESADAFRAIIAFLAERYSRPDQAYGWISHWIIFNEVDYGWTWTNMGEQPMATYMDHYHRAMRLAWLEARRFNPTAEVFITLTHNWDYQPSEPMRNYPPRQLIDRMGLYSAVSGDFAWGVAYHPYPQSLLGPRTWEDSQPTFSFATRYITPRNIEVLEAYMRQEKFLHDGNLRTLLLSEQGFHTPDYSEESFEVKAAAIAYMWKKMEPLEAIESFHYHRWVDHPLEGGLRVGLRTLADDTNPFGVRKEPAFSVLAAMETAEAEAVMESLKPILEIESWDEVQVPLESIERD